VEIGGILIEGHRRTLATLIATLAICSASHAGQRFAFVHPGLLHSRQDLERMKRAVANREEPVFAGYEKLRAHPQSQADYKMQGPFEEIGRNPTVHFREFDQDANAAYQNAILWAITGERARADKAIQILDAWSGTLRRVSGADAILMAGLGPFKMVNAAEIMRYSGAGWPEANALQFEKICRDALYPALKDFALFANGNWDTAAIKTLLAMGVYLNDRAMFERALQYYVSGAGDGSLTHYIYENGQCQESGRDSAHSQLGIAHLGDASEIAWQQGLDLYNYAGRRLLAGFEYTARYNLGEEVPFIPDVDQTGDNRHTVIARRGPLRPVYEQIYNHFVNRMGLAAPFTAQAAAKVRPEGAAQGSDHPGFGTLLFTRVPGAGDAPVPCAPSGLVAQAGSRGIRLTWIACRKQTSYTVSRASDSGQARAIAKGLASPEFTDTKVKPGALYRYAVAAGSGPESSPIAVSAGLPSGWQHRDIDVASPGSAAYDGEQFTLEGAGHGIGGAADQFHFAWLSSPADWEITARFVPQVASQAAVFGLMMRSGLEPGAAQVSLLVARSPRGSGGPRGGWQLKLIVRSAADGESSTAGTGPNLPAPYVTFGRLMEPYWLRLERRETRVTASASPDGVTWVSVGEASAPPGPRILTGLAVSSALPTVTTRVRFDHVSSLKRGEITRPQR
jgi:hypothetical protein